MSPCVCNKVHFPFPSSYIVAKKVHFTSFQFDFSGWFFTHSYTRNQNGSWLRVLFSYFFFFRPKSVAKNALDEVTRHFGPGINGEEKADEVAAGIPCDCYFRCRNWKRKKTKINGTEACSNKHPIRSVFSCFFVDGNTFETDCLAG